MKQGVKWIVGSAVFATVSMGGWLVYGWNFNRSSEVVEVRLTAVTRDDVVNLINESGVVELADQQTLNAPVDGSVERVLVSVGDRISAGEQLIILRDPERLTKLAERQLEIKKQEVTLASQRQQVSSLEIQRQIATRRLEELLAQYGSVDENELQERQLQIKEAKLNLANLQAAVTEAQEDVIAQESRLQRDEEVFARGFIAENEVQQQRNQLRTAKKGLREAQLEVEKEKIRLQTLELQADNLQQNIKFAVSEAQNTINEANSRLQQVESSLQGAQLEVRQGVIDLEKLQVELQKSEQELQQNIVSAPTSAMVLGVNVKKGDVVQQSTSPLLTLGNPQREVVKLQLSTLNAQKVQLGQIARISIIGPNATTFTGKVKELSRQATRGDGNQQATVSAIVELDQPSNTLIPGSQVSVEIVLQQQQNVPVLSIEAIQTMGSQPFVWVMDDLGKATKQSVELGLEGLTKVEIKSGLEVDEEVILPPLESGLEPGITVVVDGQ